MNKEEIKERVCDFIDRHLDEEIDDIQIIIGTGSEAIYDIRFRHTPTPTLIPYDITDNLDGWFRFKGGGRQFKINERNARVIRIVCFGIEHTLTYQEFLDQCTHADGKACGKVK